MPRYQSIDLWRGVACLMVIICHSVHYAVWDEGVQKSGILYWAIASTHRLWIGVPIFFVISGYCITSTVETNIQKKSRPMDYFWRRFRRIFPPYWTWVVCVAICVYTVEFYISPGFFRDGNISQKSPDQLSTWQWVGNLTLTEGWRGFYFGDPKSEFLAHAWTLSYEEQFYFLMGLILIFCPQFLYWACAALTVITMICLVSSSRTPGLFLDGPWLMFAIGVFVYRSLAQSGKRGRFITLAVLALVAGWCARNPMEMVYTKPNDLNQSIFFACLFGGLLISLHNIDFIVARSIILAPLRWCGFRCYSLYLTHWPVVKVVSKGLDLAGINSYFETLIITIPTCILSSAAVGNAFHYMVERRFIVNIKNLHK